MKKLLFLALFAGALFSQAPKKWHGTVAPSAEISGNLPGDLYFYKGPVLDGTYYIETAYICKAPKATPAPACRDISTHGWAVLAKTYHSAR